MQDDESCGNEKSDRRELYNMERKKSVTVILEYLTMFTVEILCGQLLQGLANKDRRKREL